MMTLEQLFTMQGPRSVEALERKDLVRRGVSESEADAQVKELLEPAAFASVSPKARLDAARAEFAGAQNSLAPSTGREVKDEAIKETQALIKSVGHFPDEDLTTETFRRRILMNRAYDSVRASIEKGHAPDPVWNRVLTSGVRLNRADLKFFTEHSECLPCG